MKGGLAINLPPLFKELTNSNPWIMLQNDLPFDFPLQDNDVDIPPSFSLKGFDKNMLNSTLAVAKGVYDKAYEKFTDEDPWLQLVKVCFWTAVVLLPACLIHTILCVATGWKKMPGVLAFPILQLTVYMFLDNTFITVCGKIIRLSQDGVNTTRAALVCTAIILLFPLGICTYIILYLYHNLKARRMAIYLDDGWQGRDGVLRQIKLFADKVRFEPGSELGMILYVGFVFAKQVIVAFLLSSFKVGEGAHQVFPIIGLYTVHLLAIMQFSPYETMWYNVLEGINVAIELGTYTCAGVLVYREEPELIDRLGKIMVGLEVAGLGVLVLDKVIGLLGMLWLRYINKSPERLVDGE